MRGPRRVMSVVALLAAVLALALAPASAQNAVAPGAYPGPLYSVSEKVGDNPRVITDLLPSMARNDVRTAVLYFGIESPRDTRFVAQVLRKAPGRVVPFYSTGIGGRGEGRLAGPALLRKYRAAYAASTTRLGSDVMRGIGEVEVYAWDMPHDDARVVSLVSFANSRGLDVMIHPRRGGLGELERLVGRFPDTTFIVHMFRPDFDAERQGVLDLMSRHPNVHYTVDVDHLLFDSSGPVPIGLLYKFSELPVRQAVTSFVRDFDAKRSAMLNSAVVSYLPLVEAFPTRVMWGTEMSADYTYDRAVYDRMIAFTRAWLAALPADAQDAVAHANATRVIGAGVTLG